MLFFHLNGILTWTIIYTVWFLRHSALIQGKSVRTVRVVTKTTLKLLSRTISVLELGYHSSVYIS